MSYNIYTTRGIVLSARPIREADRLYSILTRELGLIYARALGVRKEVSKLRSGLEPISLSDFSLVKGQTHWRLTSSKLDTSMLTMERSKKRIALSIARALALLEKLVQGEEKHPELFDAVEQVFLFAKSSGVLNEDGEAIELILVSRILFHLGYLPEKDVPHGFIKGDLNKEILEEAIKEKKLIIKAVNLGLEAANLTHRA